jgi:hypothetical protein
MKKPTKRIQTPTIRVDGNLKFIRTEVPVAHETDLAEIMEMSRWQVREALRGELPILDRGKGGKWYCTWTALPACARMLR